MDWSEAFAGWSGRLAEIRIEDLAGRDPAAPPRLVSLHRVEPAEDGRELRFYLNAQQFLAVPVAEGAEAELAGKQFRSVVPDAQLIYRVDLI